MGISPEEQKKAVEQIKSQLLEINAAKYNGVVPNEVSLSDLKGINFKLNGDSLKDSKLGSSTLTFSSPAFQDEEQAQLIGLKQFKEQNPNFAKLAPQIQKEFLNQVKDHEQKQKKASATINSLFDYQQSEGHTHSYSEIKRQEVQKIIEKNRSNYQLLKIREAHRLGLPWNYYLSEYEINLKCQSFPNDYNFMEQW